jgi:hypothetical protein
MFPQAWITNEGLANPRSGADGPLTRLVELIRVLASGAVIGEIFGHNQLRS